MTITYKELRERKIKLDEKRIENMNRVREEALALIDKYTESLQLENESWDDYQGNQNSYVTTGILYDDGTFRKCDINSVTIDDYSTISFFISTVIDDSPRGGSFIPVGVTLWIGDDDRTHVRIGEDSDGIKVINNNWDRVCFRLKDKVFIGISKTELTY
ncbi:hypothetical protein [Xenorhabdus griffiniae]|nr:hypothetical protein [Xenorhabdus griffiniae]KLU14526.1 hypothetical protein AAY47_15820 [Xenorhabdus griffiniae]KOP33317.1 hypothetical protein AFK69_10100 [Xenorhabdus sp. GDc328]